MRRDRNRYLRKLRDVHERSGLSYREIARWCDIDHSYIGRILDGSRIPTRNTLIRLLAYGYGADLLLTDEILLELGYAPLGGSWRDRELIPPPKAG